MKSALKVGPRSAGSIPGPACFDLGGYEPTVTDADLVLGYIDPKYFLGGRMKLDRNKAALAIKEHIALPLNLDVIEAAALIKRTVDATMATALSNEVGREQKIAQPTILVYGGAGPTHCCGFLKPIKDPMIVTFPFSSVFCAFGASTMTVTHYYEVKYNAELQENKINIHQFNIALQNLKTKAITDMTGEGVSLKNIQFDVEVQIFSEESNRSVSFLSPVFFVRNRKEIRLVCKAAQSAFRQIGTKDGALWIENITLKATASNTDQIQRSYQKSGKDPRLALKGRRDSYSNDGLRKTAVYENRRLQPGNILKGPALVEGEDMTLVLEEGFNYEVDEFRNGIIKRSFGD
jgi:N-methylhydantoinase A/acetophenone carboxylase